MRVPFSVVAATLASAQRSQSELERLVPWQLPDWSMVGYKSGTVEPVAPARTFPVIEYGAVPDDDIDDSDAIQLAVRAAAAARGGTVYLPPGRLIISKPINITTSNIVLQGAGRNETRLYMPMSLSEALPRPYINGGNESIYCWRDAFLRAAGRSMRSGERSRVATIVANASRGAYDVIVDDPSRIKVGEWLWLFMSDPVLGPNRGSLVEAMYAYDVHKPMCGGNACFEGLDGQKDLARWASRVKAINANYVTFEEPLAIEIFAPDWTPELHRFTTKTVIRDVGFEEFTIEFPLSPAQPHHQEKGYNGIDIKFALNAWVRNVSVVNSDHGVMVRFSDRITVTGTHIWATGSRANRTNIHGHIGVASIAVSDMKVDNFIILQRMYHDLTVVIGSINNVFHKGTGYDVNLDGHRGAPFATLWTDINLGRGGRPFGSGGVGREGFPVGGYTTYWNIRKNLTGSIAIRNGTYLGACTYGGGAMAYVGNFTTPEVCPYNYVNTIADVWPPDLYQAQVDERAFGGK